MKLWRELLAGNFSGKVRRCECVCQTSAALRRQVNLCCLQLQSLALAMVTSRDRSERGCGDHALAAMPMTIDTKLADDQPFDTGLHEQMHDHTLHMFIVMFNLLAVPCGVGFCSCSLASLIEKVDCGCRKGL